MLDEAREEQTVKVAVGALSAADCPLGSNVIQGTNAADTLIGTEGDDCLLGWGGSDTIYGRGGNDFIVGGNGPDYLHGEAGDDRIFGEAGLDNISGGAGSDALYGGDAADTIHGDADDDLIHGDGGNDLLFGDGGDDVIDGDANADSLWGGEGDDVLYGDGGQDYLYGDSGDDALLGGAGTNTVHGGVGTDACLGTECELPALTLSACADSSQCGPGLTCIADFGLCMGCVSNQDGDALCDSKDGCPSDADKGAVGACGCGVSDIDGDSDGTADCIDGCATDANKTEPGLCGCGVSDVDGDSDGVVDCEDECPPAFAGLSCGEHGVCSAAGQCIEIVCAAGATGPGVLTGNAVVDAVNTAQDLAALANVWCVTGNLTVTGTSLVDLSGLSQVREVAGTVAVSNNAALTSLSGLALRRVGGALTLLSSPLVTSLLPLSAIENTPFSIQVSGFNGITSLDGLPARGIIQGSLTLSNNALLSDLSALQPVTEASWHVYLLNLPAVTSLEALSNLEYTYTLRLTLMPRLSTLSGLGSLRRVGNLTLAALGITDLTGLASLREILGDISIQSCPSLTGLDGLSAMPSSSVGSVALLGNAQLVSLDGLDWLTSTRGQLYINAARQLGSLAGLEQLRSTGGALILEQLTGLADITALSALRSIGNELRLSGLAALGSLEGLHNVHTIGGWSRIHGSGLSSLAGLRNLRSMIGGMEVYQNANLTDLGLDELATVGSLSFYDNPLLSHCEVVRPLAERLTHPVYSYNNSIEGCPLQTIAVPVIGMADYFDDGTFSFATMRLNPERPEVQVTRDSQGNLTVLSRAAIEFDATVVPAAPLITSATLELHAQSVMWGEGNVLGLEVHSYVGDGVLDQSDAGQMNQSFAGTFFMSVSGSDTQLDVRYALPPGANAWGFGMRLSSEWDVGIWRQYAHLYSQNGYPWDVPKLLVSFY